MDQQINIHKKSVTFIRGFRDAHEIIFWLQQNPQTVTLSFSGRSNVGKSTLINALFGKGVCKTSKTPGRTREINLFRFQLQGREDLEEHFFYFFDLPGHGFAQVSKEMAKRWDEMMFEFFQRLGPRDLVVNIQDARHPSQKSDQQFLEFMKPFEMKSFLVLNKIDKLKKQKERAALKKIIPDISRRYKKMTQIFQVSAERGDNLDTLTQSLVTFLLAKVEQAQQESN